MSQSAMKGSTASPKAGQSDFGSTFALASASEDTRNAATVGGGKAVASGSLHGSATEEAGGPKKKVPSSTANGSGTNSQPAVVASNPAAVIMQPPAALPIVAAPAKSADGDGSNSGDTSNESAAAVNLPGLSPLQQGLSAGVAQAGPADAAAGNSAVAVPVNGAPGSVLAEGALPSIEEGAASAPKRVAAGSGLQSQQKQNSGAPTIDTKELTPGSAAVQAKPAVTGFESAGVSAQVADAVKQRAAAEPVQSPERVTNSREPAAADTDKKTTQKAGDPQSAVLAVPGSPVPPPPSALPAGAVVATASQSQSPSIAVSSSGDSSSAGSNLNGTAKQSGVQQVAAAKGKGSSFDAGMKAADDSNSGANVKGADAVLPIHPSQGLPAAGQDASAPMSPAAGQAAQPVSQAGAAAVQLPAAALAGSNQAAPAASTAAPAPVAQADVHAMSSVNSAQLIQSAQHSEMRVGMQSAEFGNISISTSLNHQALSAQISTDHLELGRALAVHMPAIEEKLSSAYGVQARVEVRDGGNGGSSSSYSNSGQQSNESRQSRGSNAFSAGSAAANQRMPLIGSTTGSIAAESPRLDIRV